MKSVKAPALDLKFYPLTPDRWKGLEDLFGERGACGGCWCMWWRLTRSQFDRQKGNKNKLALKKIVNSGEVPGILAYAAGKPIAWCSLGPKETYPTLERSRILKRIVENPALRIPQGGEQSRTTEGGNDKPVWSIVCLFVAKPERNKGVSIKILRAAVDYAKKNGAKIVEGYPLEPKKGRYPDAFIWTGHVSAFQKAGFVEVHRGSPTQPIMRYFIEKMK
jgi:GNAT superfamily N-acetyltransferase